MAVRFAVASTSWNTPSTWDNGAVPVAGDTVYPNGFTVPIDIDINVASLNNNISSVYLPNMNIPLMTSNTQPSGVAFSGNNPNNAYFAFDQNSSTVWQSAAVNFGIIGYQFASPVSIKQYSYLSVANSTPNTWIFQGSNDGINYTNIHSVSGFTGSASGRYASGIITNPNSYTYYRINVTSCNSGNWVYIYSFDMTESTTISYGTGTGGSFTVPSTLVGTRNIIQSGAGIISNNINTVITLSNTSGNIVNFNVTSGGYILNPNSVTNVMNNEVIIINGNGAINFNSNLWGSQSIGLYSGNGMIRINNNTTVTINGNLYASKGHLTTASYMIVLNSNSAILNINGDVLASNYSAVSYPIGSNLPNTTNITGNLISDLGNCYYSTVGTFLNLTGTVTVTNANSQAAINMTSAASLLTINGSITNKNNVNAILAPKIRFASTSTPYWIYQTNGASDMTLSYGAATGPYPVESDVKLGVTYAASPTRTGTCAVPLPTYVSQGVATGSTIGTAYLNAADVWNILTSTITVSGSIGERLKNASTVQTTGDQIASYQV